MKEIQQLLDITQSLKKQYEGKLDFSLDGRLVGDIGEALVSERFDIELYGKNEHRYDGYLERTDKVSHLKRIKVSSVNEVFKIDSFLV